MIAEEPRLTATALQTVGSKGWDGFAIAIVSDRSQDEPNDGARHCLQRPPTVTGGSI